MFFAATVGKMLINPSFGEGMLPATAACTVFSLFAMYGMHIASKRHLSKITLEEGGRTVRLAHQNLFQEDVEKRYDISEIKLPPVVRNTKGSSRYFSVGDAIGYHVYDERGVLDFDALEYILTTRE